MIVPPTGSQFDSQNDVVHKVMQPRNVFFTFSFCSGLFFFFWVGGWFCSGGKGGDLTPSNSRLPLSNLQTFVFSVWSEVLICPPPVDPLTYPDTHTCFERGVYFLFLYKMMWQICRTFDPHPRPQWLSGEQDAGCSLILTFFKSFFPSDFTENPLSLCRY